MRHRVIRHLLAEWVDPADAFAALYSEAEWAFWLDSGINAETGRSYLGDGTRLVTASLAAGTLDFQPEGSSGPGDIVEYLASQQGERVEQTEGIETDAAAGFQLGWVGWLGYEFRARTMARSAGTRRSRYPDAAWLEVKRALEFDHETRTVTLLALGDHWGGELAQWRDSVVAALSAAHRVGVAAASGRPDGIGWPDSEHRDRGDSAPPGALRTHARWRYTDDEYLAMIRDCQAAIGAGDAYQLCLTTEASVDAHPHPLASYLALRASSPTHHGGLLRMGEFSLLSSSPEQFLSVSPPGIVETRPIKGTRRRGATSEDDLRLRNELEASEKERAENLMIVDLMRNDIARISEVGTVSVPSLLAVESYAQVHQLVSTVRGRLARGLRPMDAVVACFPAGSMTGAPKLSATEILDRLEQRPRGIYSGVFGYLGFDGRIDLAMVIRSIVLDRDGATVGTGGGITALSVPEEELDEVKLKAAVLLRVLGVPEDGAPRG